jgi:hypothetical protein
MLIEIGVQYSDQVLKVLDSDFEVGIALPNIQNKNGLILEANYRIKAKILRYE